MNLDRCTGVPYTNLRRLYQSKANPPIFHSPIQGFAEICETSTSSTGSEGMKTFRWRVFLLKNFGQSSTMAKHRTQQGSKNTNFRKTLEISIRWEVFLVWHVEVQIGKPTLQDQGKIQNDVYTLQDSAKASATGPKNWIYHAARP